MYCKYKALHVVFVSGDNKLYKHSYRQNDELVLNT